jgi:hypothetical protein
VTVGVLALLDGDGPVRGLAAGFEEEGVPLRLEPSSGEAFALAREAARLSPLGLGIGADAARLVLVLAAAPGRPYLTETPREARAFGHAAARLAAGRPLVRRGAEASIGLA